MGWWKILIFCTICLYNFLHVPSSYLRLNSKNYRFLPKRGSIKARARSWLSAESTNYPCAFSFLYLIHILEAYLWREYSRGVAYLSWRQVLLSLTFWSHNLTWQREIEISTSADCDKKDKNKLSWFPTTFKLTKPKENLMHWRPRNARRCRFGRCKSRHAVGWWYWAAATCAAFDDGCVPKEKDGRDKMHWGCQLVLLTIKKRRGVSTSSSKICMHGLDATVKKIWKDIRT